MGERGLDQLVHGDVRLDDGGGGCLVDFQDVREGSGVDDLLLWTGRVQLVEPWKTRNGCFWS